MNQQAKNNTISSLCGNNRLLSKLTTGDEGQDAPARRPAVYKKRLEDLLPVSAGMTFGVAPSFTSAVEFRKKSIIRDANSNIILIGFMGAGKSSIGKRLAKKFKYTYIDTDQRVVEKIKMSIRTFIETEGEQQFRLIESEVLKNLLGGKNLVLATGGGIILDPKNREVLRQLGTIIWLHASTDTLFERARRQSSRPLLEVENPRHTFNQLLSQRLPIYETLSPIKIDTTHLSYEQTIELIVRELHNIYPFKGMDKATG
ncbi:MAG: shikimate kinase [Chthoniobacterales bacterium]